MRNRTIPYRSEMIWKSRIRTLLLSAIIISVIILTSSVNAFASLTDTPKSPYGVVTFACVGDDLIHMPITRYGQKTGDYRFLFAHVADDLNKADLSVINQETPLISDPARYAGYPLFGSPTGIADAIADAGFDIVTCATNHSLDQGMDGVRDTLQAFDAYHEQLITLGMHDPQQEIGTAHFEENISVTDDNTESPHSTKQTGTSSFVSNGISFLDYNGIRMALLNYTYGTNGIPLPKDAPWCVDTLSDQDRVVKQLREARRCADALIVFAHWGTEYSYTPDAFQQAWTNIFLENGVDVVVGSHPHLLQPVEMLTGEDGHQMLVYYSLGNFVSCQTQAPRLLGGMAIFTLHKTASGTRVIAHTLKPLVTVQSYPLVTTYLLSDYTPELAAQQAVSASPAYLQELFDTIMTQ